jgi:hypothetical protein
MTMKTKDEQEAELVDSFNATTLNVLQDLEQDIHQARMKIARANSDVNANPLQPKWPLSSYASFFALRFSALMVKESIRMLKGDLGHDD